jgi:uncharacterized lipoprotein YbaY
MVDSIPILRLISEKRLSAATMSLDSKVWPSERVTLPPEKLVSTDSTDNSFMIVKLSDFEAFWYRANRIK